MKKRVLRATAFVLVAHQAATRLGRAALQPATELSGSVDGRTAPDHDAGVSGDPDQPRANVDLGPVLGFMRALWEVDHALFSASKRMKASLGVTGPERLAIRIIGELPRIAPGELAEIMHLDPSTLTKLLQRLVRRKLIVRYGDPRDARRSHLELAPFGEVINHLRSQTVESGVAAALDALAPRDVGTAVTVLGALSRALNALTFPSPRADDRAAAGRRRRAASRIERSAAVRSPPARVKASRARR